MEKQKLPHSQASLILGILSIVTACCCNGLPGIILGFIGMNEAKKAKKIHDENPDAYDGLNNANTGRVTSIIGLVLGAVILIFTIIYIISLGGIEGYMEMIQEMTEQYQ